MYILDVQASLRSAFRLVGGGTPQTPPSITDYQGRFRNQQKNMKIGIGFVQASIQHKGSISGSSEIIRDAIQSGSFRHQSSIIQASIQHHSDLEDPRFKDRCGIDLEIIRDYQRPLRTLPGPSGRPKTSKIKNITNFNFTDWVLKLSTRGIDW